MRAWLHPAVEALSRGEAAMLVHVAELKGSGPREPGAQMLVFENAIAGTIGGGELEHTAMLRARESLYSGRADLQRYALGPELNQCCGGSVTLAFEPFAPANLAWLKKLMRSAEEPEPVFRTLRIDAGGGLRRDWVLGGEGPDFAARLEGRTAEIRERVNPPAQALWLFGAGHVGGALVPALRPLGFAITWIDGRAGQFPEPPLTGVTQLALAMPELAVDEAPADAIFLVMTHSHPLDEAVCEAVLRRDDFAYLGLIGSETKRARFVKRLRAAGVPSKKLERLTCPIGLPGIDSKEPAAIAASVAADLLIRREKGLLAIADAALHAR
ncbi:MAG: xanthine dehydrogenase accessory protein XdhC [Propylenella sp.]